MYGTTVDKITIYNLRVMVWKCLKTAFTDLKSSWILQGRADAELTIFDHEKKSLWLTHQLEKESVKL